MIILKHALPVNNYIYINYMCFGSKRFEMKDNY